MGHSDGGHYDVVVIGSGFGGSVSALRLSEKGYRVAVLEAGRRWEPQDFPRTDWNLRKYLWAPRLGLNGTQRFTLLGKAVLLTAAGVGGGSLIYGNTLYRPPAAFYDDPAWADLADWRAELAPYYDQAERMLGVAANPRLHPADDLLREVAEDMGVGETFTPTNVGVFFGEPGKTVADPYFGGEGPDRTGCTHCANCFSGCPHNAKNTLPTNYLHLAEKLGAVIHPLTTVTAVRPRAGGGYEVHAVRSGAWTRTRKIVFTAGQVVFSAAALGTQRLLHDMRDTGALPAISPRLGELSRTNSEAGIGVTSRSRSDFAQGVAITSSIHPEPVTHVEVCRYGSGHTALHAGTTFMVDGGPWRVLRFLLMVLTHPLRFLRLLNLRGAADRSVVLLVMQTLDNSLTSYRKRGVFGWHMTTRQGRGEPNPDWIPVGHEVARRYAAKADGEARALYTELVNIPATAHYIGGCVIGESAETGVVDLFQRVHGHPGLHVVDGSAITANLGVNPSLTITAQAERAMAFWPNKGDADPRPRLGDAYRPIAPVPPRNPIVPETASGALRLPLVAIKTGRSSSE
ncbi:GMC oxidoreductase [Nocardia inohanensis]|uniref:GMC oxidoreductase n=1 Tax=Nocardia inohanensis TaxID=209246 RepID=UPI000834A6E4|nr:GMC family oxidoreductase [Nocardia inohanensis]